MKLTELEPTLDPRRPLHFAATGAEVRPGPGGGACTVAGSSRDPRSATAATIRPVAGRHPDRRLPSADLGDPAALRTRAAESLRVFTGAGTGLVVAVWRHRAGHFEAALRARLADRQAELVRLRAPAGPMDEPADPTALRAAADAAQEAWSVLAEFDALNRAFTGEVRALSPLAAAAFTARSARSADALPGFERRADWGDGVLCTPDGLLAWSTTADGTGLFRISGNGLATLTAEPVEVPHWSAAFVAGEAGPDDVAPEWRHGVALLGRLAALGAVTPGSVRNVDLPMTRLVLTAAEARVGVEPVDLTTGTAPTGAFDRARFRETYSPAQNRWVRVLADATRHGRTPVPAPVLITVLPQ